jgi:hypothetical protein
MVESFFLKLFSSSERLSNSFDSGSGSVASCQDQDSVQVRCRRHCEAFRFVRLPTEIVTGFIGRVYRFRAEILYRLRR